jgi:hypothetical protein
MPPYQLAASIFYVVFTQGSLRWKHSQRAMTAGDEEWGETHSTSASRQNVDLCFSFAWPSRDNFVNQRAINAQ